MRLQGRPTCMSEDDGMQMLNPSLRGSTGEAPVGGEIGASKAAGSGGLVIQEKVAVGP